MIKTREKSKNKIFKPLIFKAKYGIIKNRVENDMTKIIYMKRVTEMKKIFICIIMILAAMLFCTNAMAAEKTADVVVAFYDANKCLVRTVIIPVVAIPGKINVSTDYEKKDYSTYKIMVWEDTENIRPLMAAK